MSVLLPHLPHLVYCVPLSAAIGVSVCCWCRIVGTSVCVSFVRCICGLCVVNVEVSPHHRLTSLLVLLAYYCCSAPRRIRSIDSYMNQYKNGRPCRIDINCVRFALWHSTIGFGVYLLGDVLSSILHPFGYSHI